MERLTHLDSEGQAHMVDVGRKADTEREAVAQGEVALHEDTLRLIQQGDLPKGDVLGTARLAGIMAAKRTPDLIPLCHTLLLTHVGVECEVDTAAKRIVVTATVRSHGKTGVEMEAMAAVSVACLTIYDMAKGVERGIRIGPIQLMAKRGGKSGEWVRDG